MEQGSYSKRRERVILGQDISFGGKGMQSFYHANCFFLCGMERVHMRDYLIGTDQKISDWLIKMTFLCRVETAVRLGIKSRFGITGFSTSDAILGMVFSL